MALETGTFISDLVATNPVGSDPLAFADDHLRLVKSTIKNTFPNISGAVTKTHAQINALPSFDQIYPVGSIYINATNGTNPGTLLGFGTWVSFGAGRVPVGFDGGDALFNAAEKTGGSKDATLVSHNHTGTTGGQSADHSHSFSGSTSGVGDHQHIDPLQGDGGSPVGPYPFGSSGGSYGGWRAGLTAAGVIANPLSSGAGAHSHAFSGGTGGASNDHSHSFTTSTNGSSATNANVQPYITVYMWKRTA